MDNSLIRLYRQGAIVLKSGQRRRMRGERGFTLLETMLVIIVIGIVTIIAVPRILPTNRRVAEITAQQITADMRYARTLAITNSEDLVVKFYDSAGGTEYAEYRIFPVGDEGNPVKYGEIPEDKIDCVDFGGVTGALESTPLTFTALGRIEGVSNGEIIQVVGGGETFTISVVVATGRTSFD